MGRSFGVFFWTFCTSLLLIIAAAPKGPVGVPSNSGPQQGPPGVVQPRPQFKQQVMQIRLLVLKHSEERMADNDADKAVQSAEAAAAKGLPIRVIGNEYATTIDKLRNAVEKHISDQAQPGDTLVIHTIGHGGQGGGLMGLGPRAGVCEVMAKAAEQHRQNVFWWQLSCYACAGLPKIGDLTPGEQEYFSMYASSSASEPSGTDRQAWIMGKVFAAIATRDRSIDPNSDYIITADELKAYINSLNEGKWGERVFARGGSEPVFGRIIPLPSMVHFSLDTLILHDW